MKCFIVLSALLCVASADLGFARAAPIYTGGNYQDSGSGGYPDSSLGGYADSSSDFAGYPGGRASLPEDESGAIPGRAGIDYPIYDKVPLTSFQCTDQQFPGYYADPEAQCQVFHVCERNNRKHSFLCPNNTIFNQQVLVCDWWNVAPDCSRAAEYYSINEQIVKEMEAADERIRQEKLRSQGGYDYTPANARTPSSQYGAPNGANSRTPSSQYGAPNGNSFGEYPSAAGRTPSSQYGAPSGRGALSSQFGAPARSNNARNNGYSSANARGGYSSAGFQYQAPSARGNGASRAPSTQYGAPSGRGNFGTPSSQYGAPSARGNSGSPSSQYGAPSASARSYLPPTY